MKATQHAERHTLGPIEKTFRSDRQTLWILVGVAVISAGIAAMSAWMGIDRYLAPPSILDETGFGASARKSGMRMGLVIGGLNLMISMGCAWAAWFQNSVHLDFHELGFASYRGQAATFVRWDNVSEVRERKHSSVTVSDSIRRKSVRFETVIKTRDDQTIILRGIENIRSIGQQLADRCGLNYLKD